MANKAGIIPSGNENDKVWQIAMQAAKGDDALARMYVALLARYHDRIASQNFSREQQSRSFEQQERLIDKREENYRGRNKPDPSAPNPFGSPGASGDPRVQPNAPTAPAPAQVVPPAYRGGGPMLPGSQGIPGSQQFQPQGSVSSSQKFSMSDEAANAYAQAPGAGDTDFSAQSRVNPTAPGGAATRPKASQRSPEQLPRPPSKKTQFAEFLPIRREWLDLMAAEEKRNGLPPGTLLVTYGMENGGGKYFGNDPNKPYGLFQWTKQLRAQERISDADAMNPAVMIPATAANMRKNANEYKRKTGKDLPATNENMPLFVMLHQWGIGDGPLMVYAALSDAGHMPAASVMLQTVKDARGQPRNNNSVLAQNKVGSNATVRDVVQNTATRMGPFQNAALRIIGDPDAYQTADDEAPRPPGGMPMRGSEGLNPAFQQRLQALMDKAPPEIRSQVRIGSGYRSVEHQRELWQRAVRRYGSPAAARRWVAPPGGSEHGRRNAADLVYDSPEARKWVHANAPSVGLKFPMSHEPWHIEVSETRQGPKFTGQLPPPTRVATVPAAAQAAPPAAAQAPQPAQPYVATPFENVKTGDLGKANQLAGMFGVPASAPITDEMPRLRGNINMGEPAYRPLPRASAPAAAQQGPQQAAAAPQAPDIPLPLPRPAIPPDVAAAAAGNEYDPGVVENIPSSIQPPPAQPAPSEDQIAAARGVATAPPSTADWSAPSSIPSIRATGTPDEQIARNMPQEQPPPDWSAPSALPSVRMTGSPDEQIARNMDAARPSWEDYPDVPRTPIQQEMSVANAMPNTRYTPQIAADMRTRASQAAGQEYPFPDTAPPTPQPGGALDVETQARTRMQQQLQAQREGRDIQEGNTPPTTLSMPNIPTPSIASIRDAIFKGGVLNAEMHRGGESDTHEAVDMRSGIRNLTSGAGAAASNMVQGAQDWMNNPKFMPDTPELDAIVRPKLEQIARRHEESKESIRQFIPQVPAAIGRAASAVGNVAGAAARGVGGALMGAVGPSQANQERFARALADWMAERKQQQLQQPKPVKTVDPAAATQVPTAQRPNAATPNTPAAAPPGDEPLPKLTPRPGAPYVPFQNAPGTTPQSGPAAPPMPRKTSAIEPDEEMQLAGNFTFERVGPGQFIAVPIDADEQYA